MYASRGCGKRNSMEAERQCWASMWSSLGSTRFAYLFVEQFDYYHWIRSTGFNELYREIIVQIENGLGATDRPQLLTARRLSLPGSCKCFYLIDEKLLFDGFIDRLVAQCDWFCVWEYPGEATAGPAMEYILVNSSMAAVLGEEIHSGEIIEWRPINWIFQASIMVRSTANKE